jgi:hypothetical protein
VGSIEEDVEGRKMLRLEWKGEKEVKFTVKEYD